MNERDVAGWCALLALGLAYEFYELARGPEGVPLTRVIRSLFRTHHPAGATIFRSAVAAGSVVLVRHICESPTPVRYGDVSRIRDVFAE